MSFRQTALKMPARNSTHQVYQENQFICTHNKIHKIHTQINCKKLLKMIYRYKFLYSKENYTTNKKTFLLFLVLYHKIAKKLRKIAKNHKKYIFHFYETAKFVLWNNTFNFERGHCWRKSKDCTNKNMKRFQILTKYFESFNNPCLPEPKSFLEKTHNNRKAQNFFLNDE